MLALSRKIGERIIINGNVIVEVIGFRRGKVQLGITAPLDVRIDREEIHIKRAGTFEPRPTIKVLGEQEYIDLGSAPTVVRPS